MRIEQLRLRNFKMFQDVVIDDIPSLAIFVGPNGGGKSTLLDAFGFLQSALVYDVRRAMQERSGFAELRTRGAKGPIEIGIRARMKISGRVQSVDYSVRIHGERGAEESLRSGGGRDGVSQLVQVFESVLKEGGESAVMRGDLKMVAESLLRSGRKPVELTIDSQSLALKFLGRVKGLASASALRESIEGWHFSNLRADAARTDAKAGDDHLSDSGDNLAAVVRFMEKNHPRAFREITEKLAQRVPGVEKVSVEDAPNNRVALKFHDRAWKARPFSARHMSEGTIKALAYLVLLNEPRPHPLICVEEPENQLYHTLLAELLEEFRGYAKWQNAQVFVTTHSPDLLDAAALDEVFWLSKKKGRAVVHRAKDSREISRKVGKGYGMGHLWRSGEFEGAKP